MSIESRSIEMSCGRRRPVVIVTGNNDESVKEKCVAAGANEYLVKPVSYERMKSVIERWVPVRPNMG
jgi:CheY-like chemotaxis protein